MSQEPWCRVGPCVQSTLGRASVFASKGHSELRGMRVLSNSRLPATQEAADDQDPDLASLESQISKKTRPEPSDLGGYDPYEKFGGRQVEVGDPQIKMKEKERSVTSILSMLAAIQKQGPQKYCIIGTRHCSYLHQQIIELL